MSTLDEITKEKQRLGEALARLDAQRDKLTSQLTELEATERVLARYSKRTQIRKTALRQEPDDGDTGGRSSAAKRASAHYDRKTNRRQTERAEPKRSGPCPGNRQDEAGNHRRMQGCTPEPCRRGDCAAQARWPH